MDTEAQQRITALAGRQHGVVTRAQLLSAGLTAPMIRGRVASKRLVPVHRGVYLLGTLVGPLEPRLAREMAAVLACGGGAVVSHRSAACLWEILAPPSERRRRPVEVTLPGDVRRRRPGITAHRTTTLRPAETTNVQGVPVTTPARTLRDLSGILGRRDLDRAAARALRGELIADDALPAILAAHAGRPGAATLRASLARDRPPAFTRSRAEELFLELVEGGRLARPRANALVHGHEVDFCWPDLHVIVEVDGYRYHRSRQSFEGDRRRDAELASAGYQVFRVTWRQIVDERDATLAHLASVLTRAQARLELNAGRR